MQNKEKLFPGLIIEEDGMPIPVDKSKIKLYGVVGDILDSHQLAILPELTRDLYCHLYTKKTTPFFPLPYGSLLLLDLLIDDSGVKHSIPVRIIGDEKFGPSIFFGNICEKEDPDYAIGTEGTIRTVFPISAMMFNLPDEEIQIDPHIPIDLMEYMRYGWTTQPAFFLRCQRPEVLAAIVPYNYSDATRKLATFFDLCADPITRSVIVPIAHCTQSGELLYNEYWDNVFSIQAPPVDNRFLN